MHGYIHSIETFGTVDGPGVRYVVFFQGCPLRCKYCHNPDTWQTGIGEEVSVDEILDDYENYKPYLHGGGITCTGGEPLLQIDFITELFTEAKKRGIHTCVDTSGATFSPDNPEILQKFDRLIEVTDLFLLDIKHIDSSQHLWLTGQGNEHILAFAGYLDKNNKDMWIRHVVIPKITYDDKLLYELGYFLGGLKNIKALDILAYHTMGKVKYENLHLKYPLEEIPPLDLEQAKHAKKIVFDGLKARLLHDKKRDLTKQNILKS
ncbi:pyruvate formate-lyase-activating protein [Johnsonella ignava]|uniref:pyruvate formate-lyase-activating protein n=1 Tax=Johnsonella ignava TaxID=43995 RepID=UPI0023F03E7C|nr:pyruvate formate-lyase-activating protein [Johnsonella ignava]